MLRNLFGLPFYLLAPEDPPEEGGGGGGGASPSSETFTKDDIDRAAGAARRKAEAEAAELREKLQAAAKQGEELESLRAKLQEAEDAKLSADEREKKAAERAQKANADRIAALEAEKAEKEAKLEEAAVQLRETRLQYELGSVLAKAKVLPEASSDAYRAFRADVEVAFDETGKPAGFRYDDADYPVASEAVGAWLKNKPWFVAAPAGNGSGAGTPHGSNVHTGKMSRDQKAAAAAAMLRGG